MATATLKAKRPRSRAARADDKALLRRRQVQRAASLLEHASDPTRLRVLSLLSERERRVGGLCEALTRSQPAVSHHLALLRLDRLTDAGERLSQIVMDVARRPGPEVMGGSAHRTGTVIDGMRPPPSRRPPVSL